MDFFLYFFLGGGGGGGGGWGEGLYVGESWLSVAYYGVFKALTFLSFLFH